MKEQLRVLIVDDESTVRNILRTSLESSGYKTTEACNGSDVDEIAKNFHPHLILLDLGLPDIDGHTILKNLRKWTLVPIIILTVADDEATKVRLLDAGANDYLTKPFSTAELLARVRVSFRGNSHIEATPVFTSKNLKIDVSQRLVFKNEKQVKLTSTEFEVLALLVRDYGRVVPQATIVKKVWGSIAEGQNHYLRIYINQLRKKIEDNPSVPQHIITEPGVGYRLD